MSATIAPAAVTTATATTAASSALSQTGILVTRAVTNFKDSVVAFFQRIWAAVSPILTQVRDFVMANKEYALVIALSVASTLLVQKIYNSCCAKAPVAAPARV
jgi:hypothetical protein